jgi:hypothetical protein
VSGKNRDNQAFQLRKGEGTTTFRRRKEKRNQVPDEGRKGDNQTSGEGSPIKLQVRKGEGTVSFR